jgi:hypothetical protein
MQNTTHLCRPRREESIRSLHRPASARSLVSQQLVQAAGPGALRLKPQPVVL